MTLIEALALTKTLYVKLQAVSGRTREELARCFREYRRTGAFPLGYRAVTDSPGREHMAAWWVVFDEEKFPSETLRLDALRAMSPAGMPLKIIRL